MQRRGAELFHGTDFSVPYLQRGRPSVMTVHDLSPWMDVAWNHASSRVRSRTPLLLRLGLASTVITPSDAVRRAVIERFQLSAESVVAVPLAARELFHPVEVAPARVPYFLFVGTLEARKNIKGLIEAWRAVPNTELLLVGRVRDGFTIPEHEGLRHLANVSDAELPALYSGATAFVYPSHYEGFGLPVLEAMQCGAPVITSTDPAITELTGDAVLRVEASNVPALSAAMRSIIEDPAMRARLRESGLTRAAQFCWNETARRTREVYASACGQS